MARKNSTQIQPAAGQQIIKYYKLHIEDKGNQPVKNSTDGYTLYRAIARQVIGAPSRFLEIRNDVLQFYLRVYANSHHPLHNKCLQHESSLRAQSDKYQLFALLDCPDLDPDERVLWVVAYALKVRIDVYESLSHEGEPRGLMHSVGPDDRQVCSVVRKNMLMGTFDEIGRIGTPFRFESLLPDESGKALIEYLQTQREQARTTPSALQIKQLSWA